MPPPSDSTAKQSLHSRASALLFALAILLSAVMLGALHTPVLCAVAAIAALAAFIGWFPGFPLRSRLPATILLVAGVLLTAFTALQALALPGAVVRLLSPASAAVWSGALAPLHEAGPAWTSLSLDPTATRVQVLRGVVYVTSFVATLRIAEHRGGARFVSIAIVATALTVAMAAVLHPAFGAQRVFGIYTPTEAHDQRHIAPLLNPNHLAAYINIGFCLSMGMALDRRTPRLRPIAIAVALLLAATQLWVASRGGAVAMVFGAVCVLFLASSSRRSARTSWSLVLPGVVVAAGLAMIVLGTSQEAATELDSADVSKIRIAMSALPLALHFPIFGVGRGAFEVAFPSARQASDLAAVHSGYVNYTHPENLLVQWLTEWGIPATLLALLALATALRPKVLVASSSAGVGAWAAIATTAVHNIVDFNSEVPAIGIAVAACAALIVAGRGNPRPGWVHRWGSYPRAVAIGLAVAATSAISVAVIGWPHELTEDRARLYGMVVHSAPSEDFDRATREALTRHPSEAYLPFIASVGASRYGRSVIPWIERTLTLAPIYPPAHVVLAEQLERQWPAQARLEYRIAMTQNGTAEVLSHAIPLISSFDDALELAPDTKASRSATLRPNVIDQIARAIESRLPGARERLDELIRNPELGLTGPFERTVNDVLADLAAGDAAPWCQDRIACAEPAQAAIGFLAARQPGLCGPSITRARLDVALDDAPTALHNLQIAAQTSTDAFECWRSLGELALASKSDAYISIAEQATSASGCAADDECANHLIWLASLEERRGNYGRALGFYERAQEKAPTRQDIIERTAQLASSLKLHGQALEAYRKLSRLGPNAGKWQQLADHEKDLLLHQAGP